MQITIRSRGLAPDTQMGAPILPSDGRDSENVGQLVRPRFVCHMNVEYLVTESLLLFRYTPVISNESTKTGVLKTGGSL